MLQDAHIPGCAPLSRYDPRAPDKSFIFRNGTKKWERSGEKVGKEWEKNGKGVGEKVGKEAWCGRGRRLCSSIGDEMLAAAARCNYGDEIRG